MIGGSTAERTPHRGKSFRGPGIIEFQPFHNVNKLGGGEHEVEHNDPNRLAICVVYGGFTPCCIILRKLQDGDCREFGASIGRNISLKRITMASIKVDFSLMGDNFVQFFLHGLSPNRLIEKLILRGFDDTFAAAVGAACPRR